MSTHANRLRSAGAETSTEAKDSELLGFVGVRLLDFHEDGSPLQVGTIGVGSTAQCADIGDIMANQVEPNISVNKSGNTEIGTIAQLIIPGEAEGDEPTVLEIEVFWRKNVASEKPKRSTKWNRAKA